MFRKYFWAVLVLAAIVTCAAFRVVVAETRRAVIVGIDEYTIPGVKPLPRGEPPDRREWRNLTGAKNDATRMEKILTARFGFDKDDIVFLSNQQATRQAILSAIKTELVENSAAGDVAFFYYSGHGSRVRNSLSEEADNLDESIVPADAAKGVRDIRDKELRDLFNAVIDKGAQLTAVFDSCHSGSIARGAAGLQPDRAKMLAFDPRDVKDGSRAPNPWERGALVLSAAQHDQLAYEGTDNYGESGSVLTIALTRALQAGDPDQTALSLFRRVKALVKASGKIQEPVLEASDERRRKSFFGTNEGARGQIIAAVQHVEGGSVTLQEGVAVGLTPGTELVKVDAVLPRLRITEVKGLVTSHAAVVSGALNDIKPGDLYVLDKWAAPVVPSLRVWVPRSSKSYQELSLIAEDLARMVRQRGFGWVSDPTVQVPTHIVFFDGANWQLGLPTGHRKSLGTDQMVPRVVAELSSANSTDVVLYLNLPATQELHDAIQIGSGTDYSAVEPTADRAAVDYHLMGRRQGGRLEYAWVRPWIVGKSETTLPTRTDWIELDDPAAPLAGKLETFSARLGRIRAWLELDGPPNSRPFPYQLSLKRTESDEFLTDGTVLDGATYEVALRRTKVMAKKGRSHYVYVFVIDSHGQSQLIFPRGGAVENRFPPEADPMAKKAHYPLKGSRFKVGPPYGVDTFFLIATSEQLPDPTVFDSGGVLTRSTARGGEMSLQDLLRNIGARTRGGPSKPVPTDWSIQRISVRSGQGP